MRCCCLSRTAVCAAVADNVAAVPLASELVFALRICSAVDYAAHFPWFSALNCSIPLLVACTSACT
jgi:hypothetical protein